MIVHSHVVSSIELGELIKKNRRVFLDEKDIRIKFFQSNHKLLKLCLLVQETDFVKILDLIHQYLRVFLGCLRKRFHIICPYQ